MIRFLLAQLHLDSLVGKRSPKAVRAALERLPKGSQAYDQAYAEAMERIEGQAKDSRELAKQALSWITCARRPLTSMELCHALAVEINECELDEQNLPEIGDIISLCAGLLTIDGESNIVRLIHYTTQEYFLRTQDSWFHDAQDYITMTCVAYLSLDVFDSGRCPSDEDFEARLRSNPLYDYAARHWGCHARAASAEVGQSVIVYLGKETKISGSSQAMLVIEDRHYRPGYSQSVPTELTGVHVAARFGLTDLTTMLIKNGYQPDCKDSHGQTPLSMAAEEGHEAVVKLLLERDDVEADSKDVEDWTPLVFAVQRGHKAIVKLLLERDDVKADSKDIWGWTPLFWAVSRGHKAVIKLLLERDDVKADFKDIKGWTPLSYSVEMGNEAVVKLLKLHCKQSP